ncbi:unnamed protein product, partial [Prorocentrum cordatum]
SSGASAARAPHLPRPASPPHSPPPRWRRGGGRRAARSRGGPMVSVLVCGGGNAAQVVSCLFGSRYKVTALSLHGDEAERWEKAVKDTGMECSFQGSDKKVRSWPDHITKDPSAARNCDVVLFTVPSSFHKDYFTALKPHVK